MSCEIFLQWFTEYRQALSQVITKSLSLIDEGFYGTVSGGYPSSI